MATGTTYTWITNSGTADWNDGANWSPDGTVGTIAGTTVPGGLGNSGTTAVIGPVINGVTAPVITINVASGGTIDLGGTNGNLYFEDPNATLNIGDSGSLLIGGITNVKNSGVGLVMSGGLITLNNTADVGQITGMVISGGTIQAQGILEARNSKLGKWD